MNLKSFLLAALALHRELLALVNKDALPPASLKAEPQAGGSHTSASLQIWDDSDHWGDTISKKNPDTLRLGFQNIGGITVSSNSQKDDILRFGINLYEFDTFGMAELNVDWCLLPENDRLYFRTKPWWQSVHISASHNLL
jgi:hypothetical protein